MYDFKGLCHYAHMKFELQISGFWVLFDGLKGLGSSARLIGSGSAYPGTYKSSRSRVMATHLPGGKMFSYVFTKDARV